MKLGKYEITARQAIIFLAAILVIFNLYSLVWFPLSPYKQGGIFFSICIILSVLRNPPKSKIGKISITMFTLMALAGTIYPSIFEDQLVARYFVASETEVYIFVIFIIGLGAVLTRISAGRVIFGITLILILYMLLGQHIPGFFGHLPFSLVRIANGLYTDIETGMFGLYLDICYRVISIFLIFAALLIAVGLGDLVTALSTWLAGNATGGPAKVAVFSSGAFGMLSGSAIANVAATGSFTIPVMKSVGYKPSMAAAVEALASTGGYMMPPIMGITGFLIAEILGIPYLRVCLAAVIPAFLWYFTLFFTVHHYALRNKLRKWRPTKEEFMAVIREKWHLIFAIFALVGALFWFAAAPEYAAFFAVIFLLILANLRKETRLTKAKVVSFIEQYATLFASLLVILATLGIAIAAMISSGLHFKIGMLLMGEITQWYLILLVTFVLAILLGMAVPPMAAYLATAVIVVPILGELGYAPLLTHMFVFYLITLAPITPPVCMASFTAAKLAGSDMMKTGLEATIKGLPLWIVPFAIFKKELLFGIGTPLSAIAMGVAMLCFGIYMFVLGVEGYSRRELKMFERVLACGTGLMIVQPISDFYSKIFVVVGVLLLIYWYFASFVWKSQGAKV